jgi:NTP pyrophosphatase (non-canonical NTP hydrolase)
MIRIILSNQDFWMWVSVAISLCLLILMRKCKEISALSEEKDAEIGELTKEVESYKRLESAYNQASYRSTNDAMNSMVQMCYARSKDAGWHDKPREVGTMLALVHSEVSEALEGFRKGPMDDHLPSRKMAEVELADAVIRIFDLAGNQGFDLGGAFCEKLEYNLNRQDHKRENRAKSDGKKF